MSAYDPITAASATYLNAQRGAGRSGDPLEITPGRVLSVFGQGAAFFAVIGLIASMLWVLL